MALNIKNEQTQRLSRELAAATGESVTQAITVAVAERLQRVHTDGQEQRLRTADRLRLIAADAGPRWGADLRARDHGDLLFDDLGLPR